MEADGEWSDGSDDALRSGSATDIAPSDGEELNNEEKKMAATNRLLKSDPVNAILDKIDAELGAMNGQPLQPKSSPKSVSKEKSKSVDSQQNKKPMPVSLTDRDTLKGKLKNKGDKIKDGDHCPSDLDSVAAEQIDEKFKEIMRKKRGGFFEDINKQQSDNETIKTEDFENKFKSSLIHNKGTDDMNQAKSSRIHQKTLPAAPPSRNIHYASDLESVQTEDFESKFSDLMIRDNNPMGKSSVQPARSQTPGLSSTSGGKPSILQPRQPNQPETLDKKSSERKIQFLENGHVHSPLDPVLKKSESSPRRMLSDYGKSTPSSVAASIPDNSFLTQSNVSRQTAQFSVNGHIPNSSVSGHTPNTSVNGYTPNTSFNGYIQNTSGNGYAQNTSFNGYTQNTSGSGLTPNTSVNGYTPNTSVNGYTPNRSGNGYTPNTSSNGYTPNTSINGYTPNTSVNGHVSYKGVNDLTSTPSMGQRSSNGALPNSFANSPTINGVISAANGTIPAFSRSLPVTSLRNSPIKPTYNKALKRLNRQLSWDESSGHLFTSSGPATDDSTTTFEEVDSLAATPSLDSLTSANSFTQHYFESTANNLPVSRQSSLTSVSSGYIAELEDSLNDPVSPSHSRTDFLLENDQDGEKDSRRLENIFDLVLTWDNDPESQSGSAHSNFNSSEVDNKMKSATSDSDFSSVSTRQKDLILPEEDSTGISFSKHSLNKSSRSDSSVRFSTESSAYSDTSGSLYSKQHSVSLPNIASASAAAMSPVFPGVSPPLSSFTSQENVNYGNFSMMNPMMHHIPSHAESVLLNLGFGDSGRCLPQRFMNSWYEKLAKAQAEQQEFLMRQHFKKTCLSNVQNAQFQTSKPSEISKDTPQSNIFAKTNEKPTSELLRYSSVPKLNLKSKLPSVTSKCKPNVKATRLARLREYVESHAGLLKIGMGVDHRRKLFSDSRQHSLPINLETLNEEDEFYPEKVKVNQKTLLKDLQNDKGLSDSFTSQSDSLSLSSFDSPKIVIDKVQEDHYVSSQEKYQELTVDTSEYTKTRKMNPNCSSDSLEVANIMKPTQIEPAMVSIILQDVDGNIQMTNPVTIDQSDSTHLHIPLSRSSSSPISPIPQSPVTVIEVSLDNQLDSLDIDDNNPLLSPRLNEVTDQQKEEPEDFVDLLTDEELECLSLQLSTSPEDSPSPLPSPLNISPTLYEDTGSSPTTYEDSSSGIQADDGSLTPCCEKIQDCDLHLEDVGDEFYLVNDGRVHCVDVGCQYEPQPSDRIKYPLFRNKLLAVGSSDSDSLVSDGQNSYPLLNVNSRFSPPVHLHASRNRCLLNGDKLALSDSEIYKSSSEQKHLFLESPALVLTNENGEDNDIDPDSDTNFNSRFRPIDSSMDSSIGSDEDQYLITKPRPRKCSRYKRSLMYNDKKESDFSNSDDSVFTEPKTRKLYRCNSVEQECQTERKYIMDSSSSSSPSPRSGCDPNIQMDRCSISSLVDQCTQTIQEASETSTITECKEIQTETIIKSFQCVQTDQPVRTAEAFCQTQMPPLVYSRETQTDENNLQNGTSKDNHTRFTSTANFTLKSQFDASSPTSYENGVCLLHQNSLSTVSSSESLSIFECSSENGSSNSSNQTFGRCVYDGNPQFRRKTLTHQNEIPQSDEDYDVFETNEILCSSPRNHLSITPVKHLENNLNDQDVETSTSSKVTSRSFEDSVFDEEADSYCSFGINNYIESDSSIKSFRNHIEAPCKSQNGSSGCSVRSFRNHIDSDISELPYTSPNECYGIHLECSENEVDRISETLDPKDRSFQFHIQEVSEPPAFNSGYSGSFERPCEQYESNFGQINDAVQVTSKNFVNQINNSSSKSSFRSSRKHADSGFYETPCNSSEDLLNKRIPNVLHGTRVSETLGSNPDSQFDKRISETIAKNSENRISGVLLGISESQIVNRVSEVPIRVSEHQAVGKSKALICESKERIPKIFSETPSLGSELQFKTSVGNTKGDNSGNKSLFKERLSETCYKQRPTLPKDPDIPYGSHMYHIENQSSQSRQSKDNINIWVSETPYIIRPEQNSLLDQLKQRFPGRRRSNRRKSVKALAYLFDNKQ